MRTHHRSRTEVYAAGLMSRVPPTAAGSGGRAAAGRIAVTSAGRVGEERAPAARSRYVLAIVVLGTAAGYYLGSLLGLQLRLLPATSSVLWPPNAFLTSMLVLTSRRSWPVVLLAAFPVHVALQLQTGWPTLFIVTVFVTNCFEAVLAAGGLHLLSDVPWRFDTLRRLAAFMVAAVCVSPIVSSFADAAAVALIQHEPYWRVWQTRIFSSILGELTIVPAVVGAVVGVMRWRRPVPVARAIEAGLLACGLFAIAWLDYTSLPEPIAALGAMSQRTPLAVQLPFLLWAAVRFGPTGAGLTLLTTTLLGAWAVVHGVGPFASVPAATAIVPLRLSLIVVAATLLSLSTLIEERRQTQHVLGVRLQFEELLTRLSSGLAQLPSDRMTEAFDAWLGRIGAVFGIDRLTVFGVGDRESGPTSLFAWTAPLVTAPVATITERHRQWAAASVARQDSLVVSLDERDRIEDSTTGPDRGGAIPLLGERGALGALAFGPIAGAQWSDRVLANLGLVADVLASALERKRSEDALRASELTKSAILQSLTSGVAVIDRDGRLVQVNDRWRQFRRACRWVDVPVDSNLLARLRAAPEAADVARGVQALLAGERERFDLEYRTEAGSGASWLAFSAVKLFRAEDWAVLTLVDMTELRRAEIEAQRSRVELAHVSRVSTVGEMTASLAHQLNQPLAAIMTNAQAAQRMLEAEPPDLDEVRAILSDIVSDDRRASDVIQRLRDLLQKRDLTMARLNLTAAIREVVELVASEAIIRNVTVTFDHDSVPVEVIGDRVQMQQVIMNLLINAMEAVAERPDGARTVKISCHAAGGQSAVLAVRDSGPGLRSGTEDLVFEPFYTTKGGGMGMGLSIVRSIVDAHGGTIAAKNADGGALFELTLPLAVTQPA